MSGNERRKKLRKNTNQRSKFQSGGSIEKLKKNTMKIVKEKVLQNCGSNIAKVKDLVKSGKAKLSGRRRVSDPEDCLKFPAPNDKADKLKIKRKKQKLKKKLQNLRSKVDDAPVKFSNAIQGKIIQKSDSQRKNLCTNVDTSTPKTEGTKSGVSMAASIKKRKKRKLENLKNDINKQIESDLKKVEGYSQKGVKKFKTGNGEMKNEMVHKIGKKLKRNISMNTENGEVINLIQSSHNISGKNRNTLSLRERMMEKLKASRFRYLNEQIYSSDSKDAQQFFTSDPESFKAYHEGYRQQVNRWPVNPVDIIIKSITKMPNTYIIADFGCGDAKLSSEVEQTVHSFDLVAANERVTACDMANVPLKKSSVDVVVFCLSLMGNNLHDYLKEANRVLKVGGILKIAEVESRFDDVNDFLKGVQHFGFQNTWKDLSHNIFYFMDFKKTTNIKKSRNLPTLSLHPCLYKKR